MCTQSMFIYVHEICIDVYTKYVYICTLSLFRYLHEVCLDM